MHEFGNEFPRRQIEAAHNAALEAGLESELVYYDTGIDLRVRKPGDAAPVFYADRLRSALGETGEAP